MADQHYAQESLLKGLKLRLGGRLSRCTAYDGNVCLTRSPAEDPGLVTVIDGSPLLSELRTRHRDRRIVVATNEIDCRVEVRSELATRILTVNRKEKAAGFPSRYAESRKIGAKEYPIYTETGAISLTQESVLQRAALAALLDHLGLGIAEGVHFSNSGIAIYMKSPPLERCLAAVELAINLIEDSEVTPERPDLQGLPAEFHALLPLAHKWALSDDKGREELLANSSTESLNELVSQVEPYLARINAYLDSFAAGTPDEGAATLGTLAECALEAKHKLGIGGNRGTGEPGDGEPGDGRDVSLVRMMYDRYWYLHS